MILKEEQGSMWIVERFCNCSATRRPIGTSPIVLLIVGLLRVPVVGPTLFFVPVRQAGRGWPSVWGYGEKENIIFFQNLKMWIM